MTVCVSLSLWLALMMSSCCGPTSGDTGSYEDESTTEFYDYPTETATPDYDYTATFDYYMVTGLYPRFEDANGKAAGIGPFSPVLLLGLAVHHLWN